MKYWIDNADSYICPVCRFETNNPNRYAGAKCPYCGFQAEEDKNRDANKDKDISNRGKSMNKVNQLVIQRDDYESKEEFENAIKEAVMVLLNNGYIMTVRYDDKSFGIVLIEFEHENIEYGCPHPYWLSPEEFDSVEWEHN